MNRRQKIITTILWSLFLAGVLVLMALWSASRMHATPSIAQADPTVPLFEVPDFELTNQDGHTVTLQTLKGRPWIGAFIFTRCPGPCPIMTRQMSQMQAHLPKDVTLVSFSLDPDYDTPQVLRAYGLQYNADFSRWQMLTGNLQVIDHLAAAMKIAAERGPNPVEIAHGTHFVLVNPEGKVHGYYAHSDPDENQRLIDDARQLVK